MYCYNMRFITNMVDFIGESMTRIKTANARLTLMYDTQALENGKFKGRSNSRIFVGCSICHKIMKRRKYKNHTCTPLRYIEI